MIYRDYTIEEKNIRIYDDILTPAEHYKCYNYALKSSYKLLRSASDAPEEQQYQKTLACYLSLDEVISHGLLSNQYICNYIKENKLRVRRYYFNLSTSNDTYCYHIDDAEDGSKTILCYLNTTWEPTWEGETHFSNNKMREVLVASSFIPGRVIIFDSSIPHKSTQPSFNSKNFRIAVAIKMVGPASPEYNTGVNIEDFFYNKNKILANTNLQEKNAIKYLEKISVNILHSNSTLFNHLVNTFCILKHINASDETCLAGLFHSIYGTSFFNPNLQVDRKILIDMLGKGAESLVSNFCADTGDGILNNLPGYSEEVWLNLLQIKYANMLEQAYRLPYSLDNTDNFFATLRNKIDILKERRYNNND
jgi:hypothetical protein